MSHLMAHAFDRFVFYGASAADRERVTALQSLEPRLTPRATHFFHGLSEIDSLAPTDLLIACGNSMPQIVRAAAEKGHVGMLTLQDFIASAGQIINLQSTALFGEVVLAFLPEDLRLKATRMFSLFGFNPLIADSSNALLKELRHGASIVVFDQDLPSLKGAGRVHETRDKIFSLLRAERRQHRQLAVIIIKDFDQGSLFGDMTTMAKDVANAMLSPKEFLEFIRNYLCDFHVAHATWRIKVGQATGLAQAAISGRPSAALGLADIKGAFQYSQDKAYHEFSHAREQMLIESRDLAARMAVTHWMFDRALEQEAEIGAANLLIKTEVPRLFSHPDRHKESIVAPVESETQIRIFP